MTGITILNEFQMVGDMFFVIPLAAGIILFIVMLVSVFEDKLADICISSFFAFACFFFAFFSFCGAKETRYEALVAPTVNVVEFMDAYEVIDRKGDIWVLRPLPNEDAEDAEI